MSVAKILLVSLALLMTSQTAVAGKKGFHCEVKKKGKTIDLEGIKSRKECKGKGGKWVKEHTDDHDHGKDGADHEHEEE